MERLQIAIEKARADRERGREARGDAATGGPSALPEQNGVAETAALAPVLDAAAETGDAAWNALTEFRPSPKLLQRNRVITLEPGPDAMPFDTLRTRIVQQALREKRRRIAVVSPHAGSGKTTTLTNLAFCFARQADLRTMVLDFDLRRPSMAKLLGQSPKTSMDEVISGQVDFADHGMRFGQNVAFGLNGRGTRNASELLQSRRTTELLADLERTYAPDFMLFDMPPLLATDDALGFLHHVDAALIIVEAERTPIRQIDTVEAQVAELTHVLGVVLNRCSYTGKESKDYHYY